MRSSAIAARPSDAIGCPPLRSKQRRGFVEAALAAPQLAQPGQAVGRHAGTANGQLVAGARQFALRFVPCPAPHADRGVLRAADSEQRLQSPFAAVFLDALAPLHGAAMIARAIAGADQIAAGQRDQQTIGQLAGEDRGAHLVELAKSIGDASGCDQRKSEERASDHLVVDGADGLRDADRLPGERFRSFRIPIVQQREHGVASGEKRVLRRVGLSFQQTAGALEPAFGDAFFAAERGAVPRHPDGDAGGGSVIAAAAVAAKRAFARVEHHVREVEPPRGEPKPFERLGRLFDLQETLERACSCLQPGPRLSRDRLAVPPVRSVDRSEE